MMPSAFIWSHWKYGVLLVIMSHDMYVNSPHLEFPMTTVLSKIDGSGNFTGKILLPSLTPEMRRVHFPHRGMWPLPLLKWVVHCGFESIYSNTCVWRHFVYHSETWIMGLGRFYRVFGGAILRPERNKNSGSGVHGLENSSLRNSEVAALCF